MIDTYRPMFGHLARPVLDQESVAPVARRSDRCVSTYKERTTGERPTELWCLARRRANEPPNGHGHARGADAEEQGGAEDDSRHVRRRGDSLVMRARTVGGRYCQEDLLASATVRPGGWPHVAEVSVHHGWPIEPLESSHGVRVRARRGALQTGEYQSLGPHRWFLENHKYKE